MIIVTQSKENFFNYDHVISIYINQISKNEILLDSTATPDDSFGFVIGRYKNPENAKAAFKKLIENILEEIPLAVVPTDEEIEKSIHQGTESSSEEEQDATGNL